jgi:hypothetical protein
MMDLLFKVSRNCGELLKRSFQIFHNLCRNHIRVGKVGAVFEAFVFEPVLLRRARALNSTALSSQVFLRKRFIRRSRG